MPVVVTQLIVDSSGAKVGVAEFEAAMAKAKAAAVDGGVATATAFEKAQQRWNNSLAATDPLIKAQIAQAQAMARQQNINVDAEKLGITTREAAAAQLDKVRQKHDAIIQTVREQTGQLAGNEKAWLGLKNATSGVSGQLIALSAGAGPVGVFLSALGPWGIAAAVGIGAISAAINHMISEANRMGDGAIAMRTFSETTGLSISQLKTLGRAGAEFGVGTDTITSSIDKFTINLDEARTSSGKLYDAVRLIDADLAKELAATTTTAQGWDVLARARAIASDQSKNALSKAAFNKGGLETGLVLDVTAEAGGLDVLVAKQQKLNGLTDEQIKKWALTKVQIDEAQKRTANLMASTYSQEVLDRQLQAAQLEERITRAVIAAASGRKKYSDLLSESIDTNPSTPRETATANLTAAFSTEQRPDFSGYDAMAKKLWEVVDAEKAEQDQKKKTRDAAVSAANLMKEEIGYLGSAATADERLTLRLKELLAARLSNTASQEIYNRAIAAATLDTAIAKQSAHNAVLGGAASVTDIMADKLNTLAKARQQDSTLTDAQIANSARLAREQATGVAVVNAQIDAIKIQGGAMGLTAGAAAEYTIMETRRLENERLGRKDDDESTRALKERAAALRAVIEARPESAVTEWKNYISVIGSAATPQERLNAAISELTLKAKEAGREGPQLARGIAALITDNVIALQNAHNAALGQSATITDIVTAKTLELKNAQQQGAGITDAQIASQAKLTESQLLGTFQIDAQTAAEKVKTATLFMSEQAAISYTIVQTKINEAIAAGRPLTADQVSDLQKSADGFARAKTRGDLYADTLQTLKQGYSEVGKAAFSAALQGKLGMDGLISTLDNVAKKLSDKAFDNLTSLDPEKMLVGVVQAGASALISAFTGDQKAKQELQKAQQAWAAMAAQVVNFNLAAKGFSLGPLTNELQSLYNTSKQLQDAALKAKDAGGASSAANSFNSAVERIWTEFKTGNQVLTPLQQQMKTVNDEAQGLKETLSEIGFSGRAAAIDGILSQQMADLVAKFHDTFISGLTTRLNAAKGQGFLNDTANLLLQHAQDLANVKDLGNDPTLLSQVSTTFHAEAQKIVDDAQLVGTAFTDFTTQIPILKDVVHEFTASAVTDAKALQDAQNSAAKGVTDYLNGLVAGQGSTQSPLNTLASAQTLYQANLPLAQSGNVDAQNKFGSLADNLEKAARVVYASGQGYQDIKNQIINQGLNLPAVQATTDPVTQAVRDAITAIQIGNAAITAGNFSNENLNGALISGVGATINSLNGGILPAVNAGNATAVANALKFYFDQIDPTGKLGSIITNTGPLGGIATNTGTTATNTGTTATNAGTAATNTGNTTTAISGAQGTNAILALLNSALNPNLVDVPVTDSVGHTIGTTTTYTSTLVHLNNQAVTALNKIVFNTYAIASNTNIGRDTASNKLGVYAMGGLITGAGTGTSDSIRAMLSNREFVIQNAAVEKFGVGFFDQLNAGIMPRAIGNDNLRPINVAPVIRGGGGNADLIAAIARLEARLDRIEGNTGRTVNAVVGGSNLVAKTVDKSGKDNVEATKSSGVALRAEMRMRRRNQRDAA
jgi:hypothetical protein